MSGAHSYARANEYNLTAVRELLLAAFTDSDLRRFCLDDPRFRFVRDHFGEQFSHYKLVDTLIRQCLRVDLLPELLPAIEKENPRQFERFADRLFGPSEPGTLDALFSGPFQAPPLPAHFVPRPEVSEAVKVALLAGGETPGVLVVDAIQGLGGIGKSVLAAALAHDPQVRASFPDGVLWATLGQEPEILSLLAGWLRDGLRDHDYQPLRVEDATLHLRTLLQDKACLLVVDDVWDPAAARLFLAGSAQCRALVTTRRADVADTLAAGLFSLDLMTDEQSLALLSARLDRPLKGEERAEALRVARAVGCLPLALELTAARVARGVAWGELGAALEAEVARLEALESARDRRGQPRLEATFCLSLDALQAEDSGAWQAFVWLGVLPEDVTVAAPAAATLWGVMVPEADDLLELLWSEALLLPSSPVSVGGRTWRGYRLHDLLRAVARRLLQEAPSGGLGLALPQAHAALLDRYQALARDGLWHTLTDDGYIHDHLAWHMAQAGWENEIHALLREETPEGRNGWYEVRERLGQTEGYVADVRRGWELATEGSDVGLQWRYVLVVASLNNLASNIPPVLLTALVQEGLWTPAQGLIYASQVSDVEQRVNALTSIAPQLPEPALREALEMLWAVEQDSLKPEALRSLAPLLSESLLRDSLSAAQEIQEADSRARALAYLIPYLSRRDRGTAWSEAWLAAWEIESDEERTRVLSIVTPLLPEHMLPQALAETRTMKPYEQAKRLAALASHLTGPEHEDVWWEAVAVTWEVESFYERARALAVLAPYLPKPLLPCVQAKIWEIGLDHLDHGRAILLSALSPCLPVPEHSDMRWAIVRALRDIPEYRRAGVLFHMVRNLPTSKNGITWSHIIAAAKQGLPEIDQVKTLINLLDYLPKSKRQEATTEALRVALQQFQERKGFSALIHLLPHLPNVEQDTVLREALATIKAPPESYEPLFYAHMSQAEMVAQLAPHLPEPLLLDMLVFASELRPPHESAPAVSAIATRLVEIGSLEEALTAVCKIAQDDVKANVLTSLTPHLCEDLLSNALAIASQIRQQRPRALVLACLVPRLAQANRYLEALSVAQEIASVVPGLTALLSLITQLVEHGHFDEAQVVALGIRSDRHRAEALVELSLRRAASASTGIWQHILSATQEIRWTAARAEALVGLAPHLPEAMIGDAFSAANEIKEAQDRIRALVGLAHYLPAPLKDQALKKALSAARMISDQDSLLEAVGYLAPHLSAQLLGEAWETLQDIESPRIRAETWMRVIPHLPRSQQKDAVGEILSALPEIIGHLQGKPLARLARQLVDLGYNDEGLTVARAVEYAWHRGTTLYKIHACLAGCDREAALSEALTAVKMLPEGWNKDQLLAKMVPSLADISGFQEALAVAAEIESNEFRCEALIGLIPRSPVSERERIVNKALDAAREIEWEPSQVEELSRLAGHLPEQGRAGLLEEALATAQRIGDARWQVEALVSIASCLVGADRAYVVEKAQAAAQQEDNPVRRVPAMCSLVPVLAEQERSNMLQETLIVAKKVTANDQERPFWKENVDVGGYLVARIALALSKVGHSTQALAAVREIKSYWWRAVAVARIIPYLSHPERYAVLREAVGTVQEIEDRHRQSQVLAVLARQLAGLPQATLFSLWREIRPVLTYPTRRALFEHLRALAPAVAVLGGQEAIAETFRAIQDVGRWWP